MVLSLPRDSGCDVIASLPQIQLKFQADDAGVGLDIAEAEVGVLAILDLGNAALAAAELGGHLGLGETGSHPGDNKLVNELGLGRELTDSLSHPAVAMPAKHLVHVAIGTPRGGRAAGESFE